MAIASLMIVPSLYLIRQRKNQIVLEGTISTEINHFIVRIVSNNQHVRFKHSEVENRC